MRQLNEERGCQLLFLPAYSPDFSPIEETFSKIKATLRRVGARTREALEALTSEEEETSFEEFLDDPAMMDLADAVCRQFLKRHIEETMECLNERAHPSNRTHGPAQASRRELDTQAEGLLIAGNTVSVSFMSLLHQ